MFLLGDDFVFMYFVRLLHNVDAGLIIIMPIDRNLAKTSENFK